MLKTLFLAPAYNLRRPTVDGRTELLLTPVALLDNLAQLVTPPRLHKHRYCGVLAPNAALREAAPKADFRRAAARCWALLLVRIYECLPLRCAKCGEPTQPPVVLPARSPPQGELRFDQTIAAADWPEMDQAVGRGDGWVGVSALSGIGGAPRRIGAKAA